MLYADVAHAVDIGTGAIAVSSAPILTQSDYRWYENINALTPTVSLAGENTAITTPSAGSILRLRMNIADASLDLSAASIFKVQYASATSGVWTDISTSTPWIFYDNPGVADGQIIVTPVLGSSDVGESYGESNPTAASPNSIPAGQRGEWDWVLANNSASVQSDWFFRMVTSSSVPLDGYTYYPALTAAPTPPTPPPPPAGGLGGGGAGGGGSYNTSTSIFPPPPTGGPPVGRPPSPVHPVTPPAPVLPVAPPLLPPKFSCVDLSGDNRVDVIDLSILLYHYFERGNSLGCHDLNNNGEVDFPDVSIMMYYWTE